MKCADGREFCAVSSEFDEKRCNDFVLTHVLPKLGDAKRETRAQIPPSDAGLEVAKLLGVATEGTNEEIAGETPIQAGWANEPPLARFRTSAMSAAEESYLQGSADSQAAIASLLMGRLSLL